MHFSFLQYKSIRAAPPDAKLQKNMMVFDCFWENRWKSLYCRSKSCFFPKIDENLCTVVQNRSKSMKIVVLSFKIVRNRWKSLYYRSKSFTIDENRCTIVQNHSKSMNIVVLLRPWVRPAACPSVRPPVRPPFRPPVRPSAIRPSVRPSGLPPGRGRPNLYT